MSIIFLVGMVMFASAFYQKSYFANYDTVSKGVAFIKGWGYLFIFMICGFMPILFASEYGQVAMMITAIIAIALTGYIFYRIIGKRNLTLKSDYPGEKNIGAKETYASIGMALYPFIAIFLAIFIIFIKITSAKKRY